MKKAISKLLSVCLVFILVLSVMSLQVQAKSTLKLNKTKATIYVGKTTTLKVSGTSKTIKWTTSNKKVATVSSKGKVTARKAGSAVITAKVNGKSYKCKVTVKNPYLNKNKATLEAGKTMTLKLTGATAKKYTTSNKNVATVSSKGKITAKKKGTATITCTASNKKTYKCTVTVTPKIHTHKYTWKTNGNTRTMKCSCGATGITEEYVAGVWGYFDYNAAQELFNWVNGQRAATQYGIVDAFGHPIGIGTVPALKNFDGLYATAKQRAAEVVTNYNHSGMKTDNENLANGCENAQACYEAWCYSRSHARTMTNEIYTQGSCAVFYYDADGSGENLYPVYVLVVNKQCNHTWTWETDGNTRTQVCTFCGDKGITEECYNGMWGYFDRAQAEELYGMVNEQRQNTTRTMWGDNGEDLGELTPEPLTDFDELYDVARQRVVEFAIDLKNHTLNNGGVLDNSNMSPVGVPAWTPNHDGMITDNELISTRTQWTLYAFRDWSDNSLSNYILTDIKYTRGSCASFYCDFDGSGENLKPFHILVLNK